MNDYIPDLTLEPALELCTRLLQPLPSVSHIIFKNIFAQT